MAVLTKTQVQILQMISDGKSEKVVAGNRCRSLRTIQKHMELARERTGARNMAQLVKLALLQGLIRSVFVALMLSQVFPNHIDARRVRLVRSFSVRSGRIEGSDC